MATSPSTPAIPVQIQSPVKRPAEARSNREAANKGNDFGSEFKRELNRDRTESSTSPSSVPNSKEKIAAKPATDDAAPTEQAQTQAATLDPWLAMLQGATVATPSAAPTAELDAQALDAQGQDQADADVLGADSSQALLALQNNLKPVAGPSEALEKGDNSAKAAPIVVNELIAADASDAASLAVDAAKLTPLALDTEKEIPAFANDLKSQMTISSDNRPQNIATSPLQAASAKVAETPVHHIATPVGESRWGDAVAQRVGLMLGRQEQKIEMQLNPPNLGPMEVRLNLAQDQASVVFSSQNAAVREALAAAMPRLTALLADQGFTLTNVQVASDSLQQHQQQQNQQQAASSSQQQSSGRELGAAYAVLQGGEAEKMQELGPLRLPVAKGGVSLFV